MTTQVKRGKIGYEDVEFGLGTFQRYGPSGALEVLTQIRASHVPILDALALYEATEIETALAEVRAIIDGVDFPETVQRVEVLCTAPWEGEYAGVGLMHENIKDMNASLNTAIALLDDHDSRHIRAAADEIDGDLIDIDYAETTYTPATAGVATHIDHLAAHLEGIDNFLGLLDAFLVSRNLTDHRVLVGSGAGPITPLGAMTDGQLVVGATGADPAPQTVSSDATLAAGGALTVVGDKIVKGWIRFNGTGVIAIDDSFNVTSITDNGAGTYLITWDTDFANANYSCVGIAIEPMGIFIDAGVAPAVGAISVHSQNQAGVNVDASNICCIAIGEQ